MTPGPFQMPPVPHNASGELRRVGFELEFAGLDLEGATDAVVEVFGGRRVEDDRFRMRVVGADCGEFIAEADARLLRDRRYLDQLRRLGVPVDDVDVQEPIEKMVGWVAERIVPFEVTTPPIPLDELGRVEELRAALAARRARGTGSSLRYAFGLHLNPEAPALDRHTVLAHLQAFLALEGWLRERAEIDLTRSLTPYVDPFPEPYRLRVLAPEYDPDWDDLAADYVEHNPTRNRPLDMLPLLVHILGRDALGALDDEELVSGRPAFHYRLPDCRLDEPGWTIASEWNRWVTVERLAADRDELDRIRSEVRTRPRTELAAVWQRLKDRALQSLSGDHDAENGERREPGAER